MHGADIQAAIRKAGSSQVQIAVRLGVTKQTVNAVVWDNPKGRSRRVATAISRAVGLPINTLWPGSYQRRTASTRRHA